MKNNSFLLILLILQPFVSCSYEKQHALLPELQQVERIMYTYPDSALRVLEQMPMPKSSDQLNHATWCLFLAHAKYKNYIKPPPDSLINVAYTYFIKQDDPQRRALALYLEGTVNEELNEVEKATPFYLEAAEEVDKTTDYQLGHLIYIGLGQIYILSELSEYAKKAFEMSYEYATLSENERYVMNSFLHLGRLYSTMSDWDGSLAYYKKALDVATNNNFERASGRIMLEMSDSYRNKGEYLTALEYAQREFKLKDESDPDYHQTLLTIGGIYSAMNKIDSAYYYLNKSLSSTDLHIQKSANGALVLLNHNAKKYEDAFRYVEQYQLYADSILKLDRANSIVEIQEKYTKEKLLNEKNQLEIEKDQTLRAALLILILLLCIIVVVVYNYRYRLLQKERTIQKNEEQLRLYTLKIYENEALINRNERRIQGFSTEKEHNKEMQELLEEQKDAILEIQEQNEVLRKENETLQENICHYSSTLQEKSKELDVLNVLTEENLRLQDRERFLSHQLLKKTKVLNELKVSPKYLDLVHWEEVTEAVDWIYEDYTKRLAKKLPSLTEADLNVCCLIKLRLTIPEIAILLGISPASVSKRKLRLKERIIQELGEPLSENKPLDLWLWEC